MRNVFETSSFWQWWEPRAAKNEGLLILTGVKSEQNGGTPGEGGGAVV
jgi:hypothetical protein